MNSIEYTRRLTATDSKLAQSPLFKFSRHKEGIRTKSHSEILAAKACQARFPSAFIRVEKKVRRERSKEREINEAHDRQGKRDQRKIYLIKFQQYWRKGQQHIRLLYTVLDTTLFVSKASWRKNIQRCKVRIISSAFRA